jgi:hypothetical protein
VTIQISLLLDNTRLSESFAEALVEIDRSLDVEYGQIIVNSRQTNRSGSIIEKIRDHGPYAIVLAEQRIWTSIGHSYREGGSVLLDDLDIVANTEIIGAEPIPGPNVGNRLPPSVVDQVRQEVDIVLRRGFGIVKGDILTAPTHGVLSLHSGDLTKYRGRPAGFWQFLNDEPTLTLTLQKLTEELDGGYVCASETIDISEYVTYQEIQAAMSRRASRLWRSAVENLIDPDFNPKQPDELGMLHTRPGWIGSLHYIIKNTRGRLKNEAI